jgi:colanic acid/amylovoran biosynthesis protein
MHATMASTPMLVPTIGIACSHEMHGIIGKTLAQEKYMSDIEELEYGSLISKIYDACQNREGIRKELDLRIPKIEERVLLSGELVKDLVNSLEKTSQ